MWIIFRNFQNSVKISTQNLLCWSPKKGVSPNPNSLAVHFGQAFYSKAPPKIATVEPEDWLIIFGFLVGGLEQPWAQQLPAGAAVPCRTLSVGLPAVCHGSCHGHGACGHWPGDLCCGRGGGCWPEAWASFAEGCACELPYDLLWCGGWRLWFGHPVCGDCDEAGSDTHAGNSLRY